MQFSLLLLTASFAAAASHKHALGKQKNFLAPRDATTYVALKDGSYTYAPGNDNGGHVSYDATTTLSSTTSSYTTRSASKPSSSTGSASSAYSGKYSSGFGIAFSQYDDNGGCKSESELAENFEAMADFAVIRLYHTDCDLVSFALKYKRDGQKLFAGMYDPTSISSSVSSIKEAFESHGTGSIDDHFYAISVGNEHVNDGKFTASQMVSYLKQAKEELSDIGYKGNVTIVDTFNAILSNPIICTNEYSSFTGANAHAFFSGVDASSTGSWIKQTIGDLEGACGSNILITETGWPTKGNNIGGSYPSIENQAAALGSAVETAGDSIILFSAWNELWKKPGDYDVEQFWGIYGF